MTVVKNAWRKLHCRRIQSGGPQAEYVPRFRWKNGKLLHATDLGTYTSIPHQINYRLKKFLCEHYYGGHNFEQGFWCTRCGSE